MSQLPLKKKVQEAKWKRLCSDEHKKWCQCGDWTKHIRCTTEESTTASGGDLDDDAAMVEMLLDAALSEGERYGTEGGGEDMDIEGDGTEGESIELS